MNVYEYLCRNLCKRYSIVVMQLLFSLCRLYAQYMHKSCRVHAGFRVIQDLNKMIKL